MSYLLEERETVLVYDEMADQWRAWSTVPTHIRKILEIGDVQRLETDDTGVVRAVDAHLTSNQVRLFASKGPSEKQREAARRMGIEQQKRSAQV